MTAGSVEVRVGGRVWFDGQGWEAAELADGVVRLASDDRIRAISIAALLASIHEIDDPAEETTPYVAYTDRWTIPAVVLAGLSTRHRDALGARLLVLRRLLETEEDDDRNLGQRYEDLVTGQAALEARRSASFNNPLTAKCTPRPTPMSTTTVTIRLPIFEAPRKRISSSR